VNKIYGTTIIIGHAAWAAAGDRISVRELDAVAVYGRSEGVRIYELIGLKTGSGVVPAWVAVYEEALSLYRAGSFEAGSRKARNRRTAASLRRAEPATRHPLASSLSHLPPAGCR
jgi:hypothetical protein